MKFGRNLIKYMSVPHIWNLFHLLGYLLAVDLQIYVRTSSLKQHPQTTRHRLCCEKLGTSHDVKGFAIGSFLDRIVVTVDCCWKRKWWPFLEKHKKRWSDQRKTDWFLAKFALKITTKSAVSYRLLFSEVCPKTHAKLPWNRPIFARICPKKSCEIWLFFHDLSEALTKENYKVCLKYCFSFCL